MAISYTETSAPVVVVGAGLAGIAAACALADRGVPVILCEKSSRLGGRAASHATTTNSHTPLGSHLFLGCCTEYIGLLAKLGTLQLTHRQTRLRVTVASAGRSAVLRAAALPHPLSLAPSLCLYPFLDPGAKLSALRGALSILSGAPALPGETMAEWLRRHRQPPQARRFLWELITAPTLNAPAELAAAELALMVFRLAVLQRGPAAALGFPPQNCSGLYDPVGSYLAERRGQLRLRTAVVHIRPVPGAGTDPEGTARFHIHTGDGGALLARAVILAVPYETLPHILPAAWCELPFCKRAALLPRRPIVDVRLIYAQPVLTEPVIAIPGLPAVWLFPQPPQHGCQEVAVSISCPGELAEAPAQRAICWTESRLAAALPHIKPVRTVEARVQKHMRATFSAAPTDQELRPPPATPIPGLFLAGDWTATGWPATMEGAVRSGLRAAEHLRCPNPAG